MVWSEPGIHPTAIVAKGAQIGEGSSIGPYSIIGPRVRIGKGNKIGAHVVVEGNTTIGDGNTLYQFASVGAEPQDLKYHGEDSVLTIGDRNLIREYVTLQPGTEGGGMKTVVGDSNLFMANSHVGHDVVMGSGNVLANSVGLAGHVTIGNFTTIGGLSGIHQFVRLGDGAFIAGGSMVVKDVAPFCTVQGDRAELSGLNLVGLERRGHSPEEIKTMKELYRALFLGQGVWKERVERARNDFSSSKLAQSFIKFIDESSRGITTVRSRAEAAKLQN